MAGRPRSRAKTSTAKPKVPCQNPTICGVKPGANHIVGTFSQRRCAEITRRVAAGEEVTADNVMSIVPPGANPMIAKDADTTRSNMDRLKEAADAWKDNPREALDFVRWSQNFTDYSPFNRMMIRVQNPDATQVAGRKKWGELGREVDGEAKEIAIFAPGYRPERPKKDDSGNIVRGPDGKPVMERVFVNKFRAIPVYDIADTAGDTPPEVESTVLNPEALQAMVRDFETDYGLRGSDAVMSADTPARITSDGEVVFNSSTSDENQRLVNRLVAAGMAVSMRLRADMERRTPEEKKWGQSEHLYAGIAAAWSIGQDAGVDMTDLAIDKMSGYSGRERVSALSSHGAKVLDHMNVVRDGLPAELADSLA